VRGVLTFVGAEPITGELVHLSHLFCQFTKDDGHRILIPKRAIEEGTIGWKEET
jgi:hypothetical protein